MKLIFLIVGGVFGFVLARAVRAKGVTGLVTATAGALGICPDGFEEVYPSGSYDPHYYDTDEFDPAGE